MLLYLSRCDATPDCLDQPGSHRQTHEKTDHFIQRLDPGILWDNFGIQSDIVVCGNLPIINASSSKLWTAIYSYIPSCRHPQTAGTRLAASAHQKNVQRSPRGMGQRLSRFDAWVNSRTCDYWRYWSSVGHLFSCWSHSKANIRIAFQLCLHFLVYAGSLMVGTTTNGPATTQKHWWRSVAIFPTSVYFVHLFCCYSGLSRCDCWICAFCNGTMHHCIYGGHLCCTPKCNIYNGSSMLSWLHRQLPWITGHIYHNWRPCINLLTMPACPLSLLSIHSTLRISEWPVFVYHWVKAH